MILWVCLCGCVWFCLCVVCVYLGMILCVCLCGVDVYLCMILSVVCVSVVVCVWYYLSVCVVCVCVQKEQSLEVQKAVRSKQEAHSLIEDLRKQKMVSASLVLQLACCHLFPLLRCSKKAYPHLEEILRVQWFSCTCTYFFFHPTCSACWLQGFDLVPPHRLLLVILTPALADECNQTQLCCGLYGCLPWVGWWFLIWRGGGDVLENVL